MNSGGGVIIRGDEFQFGLLPLRAKRGDSGEIGTEPCDETPVLTRDKAGTDKSPLDWTGPPDGPLSATPR